MTFADTGGEPILSYLAIEGWTLYLPDRYDPFYTRVKGRGNVDKALQLARVYLDNPIAI